MKITVSRMKKLPEGNLKAFADVTFDGVLTIKGCKLFQGSRGLFASLPSQKGKDEKYYETVLISDEALKSEFNKVLVEAYGVVPEPVAVDPQQPVLGNTEVPF